MMKNERKIERIDKPLLKVAKNKRVAAYCRVSMDCDNLRNSFANQVSFYSSLIQKTPNWEYAGVYSDYATSGTDTKNRHGFNEMVADAKLGKIDIILTKSISRFARNTVDLLNTVRELKDIGVEIRFEKENINTLSSDGELMISLLASFAQSESETISSNCKWGLRKRMAMGLVQHKDLFGYIYENKEYKIVPEEAKIIKLVFRLFLKGVSYTEIASRVNITGIRTRTGKQWNQLSIKDLLRQEKYAGYTIAQKRYVSSTIGHKTKRNKGELPMYRVEGTHPAIISNNDFEKAKERIKFVTENRTKIHSQASWFTGLVKCPICHNTFNKMSKTTLKCYGSKSLHTCENRQTLKISELEEALKGVDLSKVDYVEFKKIRLEKFNRKGYHPSVVVPRNIKKGDFKIVWKK